MGRPRKVEKHPGIEDRWSSPDRVGKGSRWRLRMQGLPGHEGAVVELFDDLAAAKARREALLRARSDPTGQRVEAGKVSLGDIGRSYLKYLHEGQDKPTDHYLETVEMVINRAITAGLDNVRDPEWPASAQRWLGNLTAQRHEQKAAKPAAESTRRAYRAILGGALNFAVDVKEWLTSNPFRKLKVRRTKAKRIRLQRQLTETNAHKIIGVRILSRLVSDDARWKVDAKREQVMAVIAKHGGDKQAAADDLQVSLATVYNRLSRAERTEDPRWMIAVLLTYTGMRLGQALGLEWGDIDMTAKTIRLRADVVGNKSAVDCTIEMEEELYAILKATVASGPLVVPNPTEANPKRKTHRAIRREWLRESFDQFLLSHGGKGHNAHDFRHSFVCMLTAMGVPTADIRRRVNHSDVAMTSRYADHLLTQYRRDCADWGGKLRLRCAQETTVVNLATSS